MVRRSDLFRAFKEIKPVGFLDYFTLFELIKLAMKETY